MFDIEDNKKEVKTNYSVTVTSARSVKENRVSFTMVVNGVTIYGNSLIEYKNKEGNKGMMISFPSWKGEKGYNDYIFFPITKELKENIIEQIKNKLSEDNK